jgi:hypothetical protein
VVGWEGSYWVIERQNMFAIYWKSMTEAIGISVEPHTNNPPGQNIFFYNNHPIQFVSLVGIIVARTDNSGFSELAVGVGWLVVLGFGVSFFSTAMSIVAPLLTNSHQPHPNNTHNLQRPRRDRHIRSPTRNASPSQDLNKEPQAGIQELHFGVRIAHEPEPLEM